jgi:hypothetical protein
VTALTDRSFAERYWPVFEQKPWACSATEIDWRKHVFASAQLGYLLNEVIWLKDAIDSVVCYLV